MIYHFHLALARERRSEAIAEDRAQTRDRGERGGFRRDCAGGADCVDVAGGTNGNVGDPIVANGRRDYRMI